MAVDTTTPIDFNPQDFKCGGKETQWVPDDYPDFTMKCNACETEFTVKSSYDLIGKEVCPNCGSKDLKELYVQYPTDGPGFKKGYSADKLTTCLDDEKRMNGEGGAW